MVMLLFIHGVLEHSFTSTALKRVWGVDVASPWSPFTQRYDKFINGMSPHAKRCLRPQGTQDMFRVMQMPMFWILELRSFVVLGTNGPIWQERYRWNARYT
eukprot:364615-Chlamydomonas_euryale.AAC.37